VTAILPVGDAVIVGGDFTAVVDTNGREQPMARVARYLPATGTFDPNFVVAVDGPVYALALAGDALFVGGDFGKVNGVARKSLAQVSLATGAVNKAFAAKVDRQVDTLAVAGNYVYVGGPFTTVTDPSGTRAQPYLARITLAGTNDASWAVALTGRVRSLLATPGGDGIYVGGDFTAVNGVSTYGKLARLLTASPSVDPSFRSGNTNQNTRAPAFALAFAGTGLLVGAGGSGGGCTMLDAASGQARWSHHATGDVAAVAVFGPYAYCGGHFSGAGSFAGLAREKLAAVELSSGLVTAYSPVINSAMGLWSLATTPTALIAGGEFTKIGSVVQSGLALLPDETARTAPAPPTALKANAGDSSVALSWDVPSTDGGSSVQAYRVYRASGTKAMSFLGVANSESFSDLTAVNGVTYTYAVLARNAVGDSPLGATATATPVANTVTVPGTPTAFTATGVYAAVQLGWTPPAIDGGSAITSYRIYRSQTSGGEVALVDLPAGTTSFTDTTVTVGTRYYYQVSASNAVGEGPRATEQTAVPGSGVPSAPVLSAGPQPLQLSWTVPTNPGGGPIQKYVLVRDSVRVAVTTPDVLTFTDTGAPSGSHTYQVKAVNALGSSKWSNSVTVVVP